MTKNDPRAEYYLSLRLHTDGTVNTMEHRSFDEPVPDIPRTASRCNDHPPVAKPLPDYFFTLHSDRARA